MYHLDSYSQEVIHSHVIQKLRELRKQRVADSVIVENLKLTEIYDKVEIVNTKHSNGHANFL